MDDKTEVDETQPNALLNAGCFLAPTLSFVFLVFLSTVIFNFVYRSAWFAINMWPLLIAAFYVVAAIPFAAMCADIEMRSEVATRRYKAAAKSFLLGLIISESLLIAAWFFVFRQWFTTR